MNIRMLPPTGGATFAVAGRSYTAAANSFIDVPDFDAIVMQANGWTKCAAVGPTTARPTVASPGFAGAPRAGFQFFDTTLSKTVIWHRSGAWIDPATGGAV